MARALVKIAGYEVGEIKSSMATTMPGWLLCDGTSIGNAGSGATKEGDQYKALFTLLWNLPGLSTTAGNPFVISSAKGASADADWNSNKTITIDFSSNELFLRQKGPGVNLGRYQADEIKAHNHTVTLQLWNSGSWNNQWPLHQNSNNQTGSKTMTSSTVGGTETRPKNVAVNYFIKY